ncbi:AraC family transcriptional regulator [Kribbella sp. NBC_01505]|uniref:AraC family transcriptional regulator n=1 Tax=Kribbella sp. NBC_01505 TaxID=2903580 RepID=UPI003870E160
MDLTSYVIDLARAAGTVDKRCLFAPATEMRVGRYGEREAAFHFVLEGECTVDLPGRTLHLGPGDAVLLPTSPPHTIRTAGPAPYRPSFETPGSTFDTVRSPSGEVGTDIFCGHFTMASGAGDLLLRSLPDPLVVSFGAANEAVRSLAALLRTEARSESSGSAAILNALCTALLALMLRHSGTPAPWTAVTDDRIAAALNAVLDDPGAQWTVDRLAESASMSRATFIRHFTRHTATPVATFITQLRMMIATDLLTDPSHTVASVAARVGYHSESAFTRTFQAATGQTPGRYRRTATVSRGTP